MRRDELVVWLAMTVLFSSFSCSCHAPSTELLRFMGHDDRQRGQQSSTTAAASAERLAGSEDAKTLLRFMKRGDDDATRAEQQLDDDEPGDNDDETVAAKYDKWAAQVNRVTTSRLFKKLDTQRDTAECAERVGCQDCTADKRCLWCTSPRQCLDAAMPTVELNVSCPLQAPRDFCLDFNLRQERMAFVRPCGRQPGGSLLRYQRGCCGDGECANTGAENEAREDDQNCPADCRPEPTAAKTLPQKLVETADSFTTVFGKLKEVVHDTYHCEDSFDEEAGVGMSSPCSDQGSAFRPSQWLEELVLRDKTLLHTSSDDEIATFQNYRTRQDRYRAQDNWYAQQKSYWSRKKSGIAATAACRVDMTCVEWPPLNFSVPRFGSLVVRLEQGILPGAVYTLLMCSRVAAIL
eukprot:COSAG02_NODE_881_length_16214_cov_5.907726_10_plen_407_part_00